MFKDYGFTVRLSSVAIPKIFATTYPKEEKIEPIREYFDINGELDKPITVRLNKSGVPVLTNGYIYWTCN
ncbi:MAG: hypothetical protein LUH47_02450 [Clostridiales bacterium]|nr:hypothetical protein [Clostridiales bacterium]